MSIKKTIAVAVFSLMLVTGILAAPTQKDKPAPAEKTPAKTSQPAAKAEKTAKPAAKPAKEASPAAEATPKHHKKHHRRHHKATTATPSK